MLRALALLGAVLLLAACEPAEQASAPAAENHPCRTDDDCEIHDRPTSVREDMCASRAPSSSGARQVDEIVGGQMPSMSPAAPEPVLLCFRGTCVPVQTKR